MSRLKITPAQQRAIEVLGGCRKLEANLRNLRALLMSRGQWKAVDMLDSAWANFSRVDLQIETDWPIPPVPQEGASTADRPIRRHDHEPIFNKVSA